MSNLRFNSLLNAKLLGYLAAIITVSIWAAFLVGTRFAITKNFSVEEIKDVLLRSGSWPFILQRPYGIIAQPEDKPSAIYISTYSTSPLDVDFDFVLKNQTIHFF